jgi:hypothetical protein
VTSQRGAVFQLVNGVRGETIANRAHDDVWGDTASHVVDCATHSRASLAGLSLPLFREHLGRLD